jgi:3-hydroxyacyl-[acyl-carrier-protein] dehydratase
MTKQPPLSAQQVLERIPQQEPFRFIDEILEIDSEHVEATYRWRPDADFYRGHFPGNPVTPGVLLVESMAQASLVAQGIYLLADEQSPDEALKFVTVFTDANVEFSGMVRPGDRVRISSKKVFYRRRKLRVEAKMCLDDGSLVCSGVISGMGVPK